MVRQETTHPNGAFLPADMNPEGKSAIDQMSVQRFSDEIRERVEKDPTDCHWGRREGVILSSPFSSGRQARKAKAGKAKGKAVRAAKQKRKRKHIPQTHHLLFWQQRRSKNATVTLLLIDGTFLPDCRSFESYRFQHSFSPKHFFRRPYIPDTCQQLIKYFSTKIL